MRSMTGYGRASLERDGRELTLELKTVNHRFLDLNIRLPRALLFLEDGMRKGLNARLSRGHVDVFINYRNAREDAREVTLDGALLKAYARAMDEAAALLPDVRDDRSLARLVTMPDVLVVAEKAEDQDAVTALCADVLNLACDALEQMRAREGESIGRDLAAKVDNLERVAGEIAQRAPGVVEDYQRRLNERIAELLQSPPDPLAAWRRRSRIFRRPRGDRRGAGAAVEPLRAVPPPARAASEPVRPQARFPGAGDEPRVAGTIGSKASDLEIGRRVVEAKAEIEKIREQVQASSSNGARFVNIGFGSLVNAGRIVAVVSARFRAGAKRLLRDAEDRNQLRRRDVRAEGARGAGDGQRPRGAPRGADQETLAEAAWRRKALRCKSR